MKATFITWECLLHQGTKNEENDQPRLELGAAAQDALRSLSQQGFHTIAVDTGQDLRSRPSKDEAERLFGRIGLTDKSFLFVQCPHSADAECNCWGSKSDLLGKTADQLDLRLNECYLIGYNLTDVATAFSVGCRPYLVLSGRTVSEIYGDQEPARKDFPIAQNLAGAINYLLHEEEIAQDLGPFMPTVPAIPPKERISPASQRLGIGSLGRWLVVFIFGGTFISLGVAYLLTHLYRIQPFPAFVYYLTLQFIPRPIRGFLFIVTGLIVLLLGFQHMTTLLRPSSSHQR